jgi:hypothetical protein
MIRDLCVTYSVLPGAKDPVEIDETDVSAGTSQRRRVRGASQRIEPVAEIIS